MPRNTQLENAKRQKKDEFYTQLSDIERELSHYRDHFRGKTVLCNCDDPYVSNFFLHFFRKFSFYGLKRLVSVCYRNCSPDLFSRNQCDHSICLRYDGGADESRDPTPEEISQWVHPLQGDGDFRSPEGIALLRQADIVCTNPPFSLFREYVATLVENDRKFLVIGHQNAITYKEIFPLIMANKIWLGYGFKGGAAHFINVHYEDYATSGDHREGMIRVSGVTWFTNLEIPKRNEEMILFRHYTPEEYPRYVNYDAIEVGETAAIPCDYDGKMGVPITFLDKYNPSQFEIVGISLTLADMSIVKSILGKANGGPRFYVRESDRVRRLYDRIVIRRRK